MTKPLSPRERVLVRHDKFGTKYVRRRQLTAVRSTGWRRVRDAPVQPPAVDVSTPAPDPVHPPEPEPAVPANEEE